MAAAHATTMMTALIVFFGLSSCATVSILAAVALGARRATVHGTSAQTESAASTVAGVVFSH